MVYVFLAEGFEEIEALTPVDLLRRAGAEVRTVGVGGKLITGSHGIPVTADLEEKEFDPEQAEMLVLPGGAGTKNLDQSPFVRTAVASVAERENYLAAICAAPSVLGHMGLLKGHQAVCFPGYEEELHAASIPDLPVCVSGKIITARGAGVAVEFGLALVKVLFGSEKSQEIRKKIQCM